MDRSTSHSARQGFVASSSHSSASTLPRSQTSRWSGPEGMISGKVILIILAHLSAYGGYGIDAGGDPETVPMTQLLPLPPIKGNPGRVSAVRRHRDLQFYPRRHDYWPAKFSWDGKEEFFGQRRKLTAPEWEGVWTYGGDHDRRDAWVDHARPRGHCICCAPRRRGHDQSVAL